MTLEAIADVPCLVLLGEPGTGKSQELENLKVLTENKICDPSQVLELNLQSCTNLKDDLFKEETFIDWLGDTYYLYLFLDSLDEGLLSIPNIATGLIEGLKILCPPVRIPIEVLRRLYEIVKEHYNKA